MTHHVLQPAMPAFKGFSQETVTFYQSLVRNNNKGWFEAHKADYQNHVIAPAREFVLAMAEQLRTIAPGVVADTRTNGSGSIFRIYRDIRFSQDKSPYKTFLGILWWEGTHKKTENSGFYFQLSPDKLFLGVGIYMFTKPMLNTYRNAVVHLERGKELQKTLESVMGAGQYQIGGEHYKRVPRGYDSEHPNAKLLKYNGLHAYIEEDIPEELYSPALLDDCLKKFHDMLPVHQWLFRVMDRR